MIPHYKSIHNKFKINGLHLNKSELLQLAYIFIKEGEEYEIEMGKFLLDWFDNLSTITLPTSGTTGSQKLITLHKQAMVNSAIATADFFNLKPGDTALHCLPTRYIAGKMMLVRAIIIGLEIDTVNPTNIFNKENINKNYSFCAMVPIQAEKNLSYLKNIHTLILGGTPMNKKLINELSVISKNIYETYGMTETITHIAAKKIGDEYFKTFPEVEISQDDRGCIVIEASYLFNDKLVTNDLVEIINANHFKWLGRADNVINSGGIKIFPEQIEQKLLDKLENRFYIGSKKDEKLGQHVVLYIEGKPFKFDEQAFFKDLSKYEIPKEIIFVENFNETETGKIIRN